MSKKLDIISQLDSLLKRFDHDALFQLKNDKGQFVGRTLWSDYELLIDEIKRLKTELEQLNNDKKD